MICRIGRLVYETLVYMICRWLVHRLQEEGSLGFLTTDIGAVQMVMGVALTL